MRLTLKVSAVASFFAVTALSIQTLSPTTAAEGEPQVTASETPAAPDAAETTAEPEEVPGPPTGDTEGLIDVTNGEKTSPIELPLAEFADPLNALRFNLTQSGVESAQGDRYDGSAVGLYIDANVADVLKLTSRKVAAVYTPKGYRGGADYRESVRFELPGFFFSPGLEVNGLESKAQSNDLYFSYSKPIAISSVRVAELNAGGLLAEGIDVTSRVEQRYPDNVFETTAKVHFARLKFGNNEYTDYDMPPNTTHTISGLGKVVFNEQKITELPGDRYAAKVNAVRITLSTASFGLPVGTNIYIGSAEAVVYE